MLTREKNDLITKTGPGTLGGRMMREYWHPVALTEELPVGGDPLPVRILGEDLLLIRDDQNRVGLLGMHCPHRCTDLSYGRLEDGGLRCIYHGWLFDVNGNCLEQPGEPAGSNFKDKIKHLSYPCMEKAGVIFTYMGSGEPPLFPAYEFLDMPEEHLFMNKIFQECNYLQANEGNIDPVHTSFLHRPFKAKDSRPVPGTTTSADSLYGQDIAPSLEIEKTDFGIRIYSTRKAEQGKSYLRITNFIMPNLSAIVGNEGRIGEGYSIHWHVPIDDTTHWRYEITFNRKKPVDKESYRRQIEEEVTADRRLKRNRSNRYLQDREALKTDNYTGMGDYFPAHDACAVETQGLIQDRSLEHLGYTDKAIAAARQLLLQAVQDVQEGRDPLFVTRDPQKNRLDHLAVISAVVPDSEDLKEYWKTLI